MTIRNRTTSNRSSERLDKDNLIDFLNERVRDDTIEKAAFLADFDDPEYAFKEEDTPLKHFKKDVFGVVTVFSVKDDMDKASVEVALSAYGYEPVNAASVNIIQKTCGRILNTYPEYHSLELYEDALGQFRSIYEKVTESDSELNQKTSELRKCNAALRSLTEEDVWLNRENRKRVSIIQDCEKQAIAHQEARREAEEKLNVFDEQLTDANEKLPIELAELEKTEQLALQLEQEIAALEKKNTFFGTLFRRDREALRAEISSKQNELEDVNRKRETSVEDTQKLKIEIERLEETVRTHKSEAARRDSEFIRARENLIQARKDYNDGEKRFAISQDRIKDAKRKVMTLQESVRLLEEKNRSQREECLQAARRLLMAFQVSSPTFRKNLKEISLMKDEEITENGALENALFLSPALFLLWPEARGWFTEEDLTHVGTLISYSSEAGSDSFKNAAVFRITA